MLPAAGDWLLPTGRMGGREFQDRVGVAMVLAIVGWFLGKFSGSAYLGVVLLSWPWACLLAKRARGMGWTPWLALSALMSPLAVLLSVLMAVRRP